MINTDSNYEANDLKSENESHVDKPQGKYMIVRKSSEITFLYNFVHLIS